MSTFLGDWTYAQIHQECSGAYNSYRAALDAHYAGYFVANPSFASSHPQKAGTLELALPPGMEELAELIPTAQLHRHHLSGKSSQLIGLGLLGAAAKSDPSLHWFEQHLAPVPPFPLTTTPTYKFEYGLDRTVLNEHPRVTAVDFLVETDATVICTEVKFAEDGMGRCSCGVAAIATGACSKNVLDRALYWDTAAQIFFLPDRVPGKPCPISVGYQAIRNVAAARALAAGRMPVFVLLYDERNPYFRPTNNWPVGRRCCDRRSARPTRTTYLASARSRGRRSCRRSRFRATCASGRARSTSWPRSIGGQGLRSAMLQAL